MRLPLETALRSPGLSPLKGILKRVFDLVLAIVILPIIVPLALLMLILAKIFNGQGLFVQRRVGLYGELFNLYKVCSMRKIEGYTTNITTDNDPRITTFGRIIRKTKFDEFPQILNVIKGDMSFVGPRPDVIEAYQDLKPEDAVLLCVRPGITGVASVAFKDEEGLLAAVDNPEEYNRNVVFPAKVKLNKDYINQQSLLLDFKIMAQTVIKVFK